MLMNASTIQYPSPSVSTTPGQSTGAGDSAASRFRPLVPIRSLGPSQRDRIARHLKALDERGRYLRFGYAARDEQIEAYVQGLDFERDDIYGVFNRRLELIAMAHLAFAGEQQACESCAEFGVSVSRHARSRGYATRLFERAVMHACNEGVQLLFIHALSENTAMLRIARKAGAVLDRAGSETDAYLRLPAATVDTHLREWMEASFAETDFQLKRQARQFQAFRKRFWGAHHAPAASVPLSFPRSS